MDANHHITAMAYQFAANGVLLLHLGFIVFVVLGGLFALRWWRVAFVHLPCAAWGAAIEFGGWICPLTPLEWALRARAGQGGFEGGFIDEYLWPLVYPEALTRDLQIGLGVGVVLLNLVIYAVVIWRRRA
jgi:hypothetical protein